MSNNPNDSNPPTPPGAAPPAATPQQEDTAKFAGVPKQSALNTQEHIRQLTRRIDELIELLRTQRDILRQKGMNLPSGSLDSLRSLKMRLDALGKQLVQSQMQLKQLRALADNTALINSSLDPKEVLNQVMDTVIHLTGAERGYIMLKNKETGEIDEFAVARGIDQEQLAQSDFTVSRTVVRQVAEKREPILTDNAQDDPRFQQGVSIAALKLLSILAVPLMVRDNVIGVVYCDNKMMVGIFNKEDVNVLVAFANQAAVAIENARLFESMRENLARVTEIRDRMNNIFTSITSGVITVDNRNVVITCNAAAGEIIGKPEVFSSVPLTEILPELGPDFFEMLKQVRTTGQQASYEALPVLEGRGQRSWNVIASPLRDSRGAAQGVVIVFADLTEIKQQEEQMRQVTGSGYLPQALARRIASGETVPAESEEREITAIFCDIRGFTTFSGTLQPEELMRIINKYLAVASDGINLYEGIVDKYMGDAVTGLFNTQLNPQENHPELAVRAALSIIYDVKALHEVLPDEAQHLKFGIGIHTGKAVLGNVGSNQRREFAAMGEATDISKILQENAGKGEVVISPETFERVKDMFECEEFAPPPEKTKGKISVAYKVKKAKKGVGTGRLMIDPELADLLNDLKTE